ncbi:DUF4240 domain-containing protein [Streptomyces sp. WAC 00631]|uniref:DUF4240 domain-containing protein n=1 Tax=Streptomyces sp. WAC 00631 TaxID=2203201 RepID=UPI000F772D8D|nr:DUF4240 domain-containing protein [Streptomyces sp. WAC 00631]MCC5034647.1 DUF4240 domain-containing protein [Streptomyces sp. WAC 00631]
MDETEFWAIVDSSREAAGGDPVEQADALVERLVLLDPESVVDFARHFESRLARAHRWDLWAAAWLLTGEAGEDAFDGFRCWLIGQGRQVFEGALHEPDDLAELLEDFDEELDGEAEDLGYAPYEAYEQLTAVELPDLGLPEPPAEPEGTPLDFGDRAALAERFPALTERFPPPR